MNSKLAADERENFFTIDSQNLSTGIGLLILTACDLREQGLSAKEIYEKIEATKPLKLTTEKWLPLKNIEVSLT